MKIQAYKIGNQAVGVDIDIWMDYQLNGNPPFIASENLDNSYQDISSISNWFVFGPSTDSDYNLIRESVSLLVASIGFGNLNQEEKIIAAKYFLVGKADRDTVLTEEEQKISWNELVQNSLNCRNSRWTKAKNYISYNLTPANSSDLAISTSELCLNYINYNITSNALTGKDGLYDFIQGTSGYSTTGFPSKSYWTQDYQDSIMRILTKGK